MKKLNVYAKPSELQPCPFCGSANIANVSAGFAGPTDRWHANDEIFAVNCKGCGGSVPNRYQNSTVVEQWNMRTAALSQPGRNALLLKALKRARRAIDSMKQSAETAGAGGDEAMLQEACEEISQFGLKECTAIDAAIAKGEQP